MISESSLTLEEASAHVFVFPASFAQQRLWFLHQLDKESSVYHIAAALHLSGALDLKALERSLGEIVQRHEALRTAFMEIDEQVAQLVHPVVGPTLAVVDLTELSAAARAVTVERLTRGEIGRASCRERV